MGKFQPPRLLITLGDVAGIGPEVLVKAWGKLQGGCRLAVVGDPAWIRRAFMHTSAVLDVVPVRCFTDLESTSRRIVCINGSDQDLSKVVPGQVSAAAGRAAYDYLRTAIDLVMANEADGIVTLPLHKEGLHAAGINFPGHTEILADRVGVKDFGMMLYAKGPLVQHGVGVVHVTLHMALRDVFQHLTTDAVREKIHLLDTVMFKLRGQRPRLAVAALNPHGSDGGLFGDEERTIIAPAVALAREAGLDVSGPIPSDTLFVRAQRGEFDGVVAMYHDQGHIPLKLLSGLAAVNVTLGLPFVRTSVAHGTAYDIVDQGRAEPDSLVRAVEVAESLARPV